VHRPRPRHQFLGGGGVVTLQALPQMENAPKCEPPWGFLEGVREDFLLQFTSLNTQNAYDKDVGHFVEFLSWQGLNLTHPTQVTSKMVNLWVQVLWNQRLNDALGVRTVARKLSGLRSLFRFLFQEEIIPQDPCEAMEMPKVPTEPTSSVLNPSQLVALVTHLRQTCQTTRSPAKTKRALTDLAILETLLFTGMRVTECVSLSLEDLDWSGGVAQLRVILKGGKVHRLALSKTHESTLVKYLWEVRGIRAHASCYAKEIDFEPKAPLFCSRHGKGMAKPFHRSGVFRMVGRVLQDAQLDVKLTPHGCRATLATLLHEEKVPASLIQKKLGHASLETTLRYIQRNKNALIQEVQNHADWVQNGAKDGTVRS